MLQDSSPNPSAVYLAPVKVYTPTHVRREPTVLRTWKLKYQVFSPSSESPLQVGRLPQAELTWVQTWRFKKKNNKKRTERKKKISYTELFCMPEDREQNMQIVALWSLHSCHCLQPALLTSPVNTSPFTTTSALLFYSPFKTAASLWFLPVGASICTPACICAPLLV